MRLSKCTQRQVLKLISVYFSDWWERNYCPKYYLSEGKSPYKVQIADGHLSVLYGAVIIASFPAICYRKGLLLARHVMRKKPEEIPIILTYTDSLSLLGAGYSVSNASMVIAQALLHKHLTGELVP